MYVASIISMNYDDNESSATHLHMCSHWVLTYFTFSGVICTRTYVLLNVGKGRQVDYFTH